MYAKYWIVESIIALIEIIVFLAAPLQHLVENIIVFKFLTVVPVKAIKEHRQVWTNTSCYSIRIYRNKNSNNIVIKL